MTYSENMVSKLALGDIVDEADIGEGQKQRLLIARAVYKIPEFLLLDEATCKD